MNRFYWSLCCVLFLSGCGSDFGPGKVTGVITLDGKPLADATVSFNPESGGVLSMGGTDANGRYKLYYADMKTGAPVGRYKVCVTTEAPFAGIPERVPLRYLSPATTDLFADVKKGTNTCNFDLTFAAGDQEELQKKNTAAKAQFEKGQDQH